MDPNANLREQLSLAQDIASGNEHLNFIRKSERLAELVIALDEWLTKGGFLPDRWG